MNDKELLERARNEWGLSAHFPDLGEAMHNLFNRFEQILDDKEPQSIVWVPKAGETYWSINGLGQVNSDVWSGSNYDQDLLKRHTVYKTRVQAVRAAPHQSRYNMVLQAVINLEPDQVVDWKNEHQPRYGVYFDHASERWEESWMYNIEQGYPPLTDKKNVQPLLDYLNAKEKENG